MIDDEHHEALGAMIHAMKPRQPTQEELEKPCHETLPFTPGPLLQTINHHREIADERDRLRKENEKLREALREIEWSNNWEWQRRRAQTALAKEPTK